MQPQATQWRAQPGQQVACWCMRGAGCIVHQRWFTCVRGGTGAPRRAARIDESSHAAPASKGGVSPPAAGMPGGTGEGCRHAWRGAVHARWAAALVHSTLFPAIGPAHCSWCLNARTATFATAAATGDAGMRGCETYAAPCKQWRCGHEAILQWLIMGLGLWPHSEA